MNLCREPCETFYKIQNTCIMKPIETIEWFPLTIRRSCNMAWIDASAFDEYYWIRSVHFGTEFRYISTSRMRWPWATISFAVLNHSTESSQPKSIEQSLQSKVTTVALVSIYSVHALLQAYAWSSILQDRNRLIWALLDSNFLEILTTPWTQHTYVCIYHIIYSYKFGQLQRFSSSVYNAQWPHLHLLVYLQPFNVQTIFIGGW